MTEENASLLAGGYFSLEGKIALVTGASSGLGRSFAKTLAEAGCTVGIAARRLDRLESLAAEIGDRAIPLEMDVTDRGAVESGLEALAEHGTPAILVNNAGVATGSTFLGASDGDTARVFALNQMAAWQVAQATARRMVDAGTGGSIVNIASITGLRQLASAASYAVSKAAVVQMTKVMALELARYNIRVNAIAPGYFDTDMTHDFLHSPAGEKLLKRSPMRRAGLPQELDGLLLLLASDRGSFITGAAIPVDGGHLVSGL